MKFLILAALACTACAPPLGNVRYDGVVTQTRSTLGRAPTSGVIQEGWRNVRVTRRFYCAPGGCSRLVPGKATLWCNRSKDTGEQARGWQPAVLKGCEAVQ